MTAILTPDLTSETVTEPMEPEDIIVAIVVSAQKNGAVTIDEIVATCEAAGRADILEMAKELSTEETEETDPLDDPDPDEDDVDTE